MTVQTPPTTQKFNRGLQELQNNIYWPQLNIVKSTTTSMATTTTFTTTKSTAFRSLRLTFIDQNYVISDNKKGHNNNI